MMRWKSVLLIILVEEMRGYSPQQSHLTETFRYRFGSQVLACRNSKKLYFDTDVIDGLLQYWDYKVPLTDPEIACEIRCVLQRLALIDAYGTLQEKEVKVFMKANGFDDITTRAVVDLYQICKDSVEVHASCRDTLVVARCLRTGITMLGLTPQAWHTYQDIPYRRYYCQ